MRSLFLSDWLLQHIEKASGEPLNRQLYRLLQTAILTGRLAAGAKLPSSRILAKELGLSRNTIVRVYDQLLAEQYVHSSAGSGTTSLTPVLIASKDLDPALTPQTSSNDKNISAARGEHLIEKAGVGPQQWGAFMPGVPDVLQFPLKTWNRIQGRIWNQPRPRLMTYARLAVTGHCGVR